MSLHQTLVSNSIYRLLNIVAQFLVTILLTRLMGVQGYGSFSLLVAVANIFNLMTSLGLEAGISYHIASNKIPFGGIAWLTTIIVIAQVLLWFFADMIYLGASGEHLMGEILQGWQVPGVIALIVGISLIEKFTALFNGYHFYSLLNKLLLYTNLIVLAAFTICWLYFDLFSVDFYILIYVAGSFLQLLILVIFFRMQSGMQFRLQRVPGKVLASFFSFIMIVYVSNLVQFIAYRADYGILENYYPKEKELGWYALAVKLVQFFWIVPNLLASILLPNVAAQDKRASAENISRLIRVMNGINLLLGLLSALLVGVIIRFFFGEDYGPSVDLFLWLLPGTILFCITTVLAAFFSGINKPVINLYSSVVCLAVVILLDFLLIPSLGKKGAAIASTIAYSVTTGYMIAMYCKTASQPFAKLWAPTAGDMKSFYTTIQQLIGKK